MTVPPKGWQMGREPSILIPCRCGGILCVAAVQGVPPSEEGRGGGGLHFTHGGDFMGPLRVLPLEGSGDSRLMGQRRPGLATSEKSELDESWAPGPWGLH